MYEVPGKPRVSQPAIRKSPSMPMLDIAIIGGDALYVDGALKCPLTSSGRKSTPSPPMHRKLNSAVTWCIGILVCTVVLFVLVALDPTKVAEEPWRGGPRMRVTLPNYRRWSGAGRSVESKGGSLDPEVDGLAGGAALEGMGMLFRRGTGGMMQLLVAHLVESTTAEELRLFLRGLHRSGMPAQCDVALLFPFRPVAKELLAVVRDEEIYFQKLLASESQSRPQSRTLSSPKLSVFNRGAYTQTPPPVADRPNTHHESMWGRVHNNTRARSSTIDAPELQPSGEEVDAYGVPHYGAVVGFDVQELDPDDTLSGFLHSSPMHLRRWLGYQMLLGMVRHRFRHVLLTEVTGVVILTDSLLSSLKKKDSSQLHLFATAHTWSNNSTTTNNNTKMETIYGPGVWNSLDEAEKRKKLISTGAILGGVRPVRSVATAMATEIVRVALLRKSRDSFSDESLLSYLVHKSSALGRKVAAHLQVHESGTSSVNLLPSSSPSDNAFRRKDCQFALIQGLHNSRVSEERRQKILELLLVDICQSQTDPDIYPDCFTESQKTEPSISSHLQ